MTAYLLAYRAPHDYTPDPGTFDAWARWQLKLGARLKDRGNVAMAAAAIGASTVDTSLGGYSIIRATSLGAAADLAHGCPLLGDGGAVEIGELANLNDQFDDWLAQHLTL